MSSPLTTGACAASTRSMHMMLLWISCSVAPAVASDVLDGSPASEASSASGVPTDTPSASPASGMAPAAALTAARSLLREGDPQGAFTLAILADAGADPSAARFVRAQALIAMGRAGEGVLMLDGVAASAPKSALAAQAHNVSGIALLADAPGQAERHFAMLQAAVPSDYTARMHALAQVKQGLFPDAQATLQNSAPHLVPELQLAVSGASGWRRPGTAAALAIVPGIGHFYAGSPRQAASALIVNGVFATGIALAAQQKSWGTVGVLGFFGLGFYMGNVYGAADAAKRHNRRVLRSVERDLAHSGWQVAPNWQPPVASSE